MSDVNVILSHAKRQFKLLISKVKAIKNNSKNNTKNNTKSELDILKEKPNTLRKEVNIFKNDLKMQRKAILSKNKVYDNTHTKIIKLQKGYILLVKDIEIPLKKFIYERFLYPKFKGKRYDENTIVLASRRRLNSTIYIDENEIFAIAEKKNKQKEYYIEIILNSTSIIIINDYTEYKPHMKRIINKKSYTEMFNNKIVTYLISHVTCRKKIIILYTQKKK